MTAPLDLSRPDPASSGPEAGPSPLPARRDVVVLGSTGSVGVQAEAVVADAPGRFRIVAVGARGSDLGALAAQAVRLQVQAVAVADESLRPALAAALAEAAREAGCPGWAPQVLAGPGAAADLATWPADVVLNGITGSVGLAPTLAALGAGRLLALANKESLVAGGALVTDLAAPGQIVPVDSEHSAIAQALRGGRRDEVRRLVLTASGGPFRGYRREQLAGVSPDQALAHPTWSMGPVVTTNSATMVNKALEVIEAHVLFGVPLDRIDVVVHPQSVVHSMVEFDDGSTLAQCSPPDMRLPIALGLGWPHRVPRPGYGLDLTAACRWDFEPLDEDVFRAVRVARAAVREGSTAPAVFNAANEVCVQAFWSREVSFLGIVDVVEQVVTEHVAAGSFGALDVRAVLAAEAWGRARAREVVAEVAP